MASGGSDRDVKNALSKLLQMGEAFPLGCATKARFRDLQLWELLRSNPTTLVEAFFKTRITEACFEDEQSTTPIVKANDQNTGVQVQDLELETKLLVDGKQDDAKVVKVMGVAGHQNSDEPNVLKGNSVIGVGSKHILKVVPYPDTTPNRVVSIGVTMGKVSEYQNEFEILINQVTGISQLLLILFYMSGLKLELQRELWRSRPTTLGESFSLARIAEARFDESVRNHLGPLKYEDPQGALSKLLQLGTVEDYQREFDKLMNKVTDIPDSLLIYFYISGLKLNLQHDFLVSRPTTLDDAFSLARITEAPFEAITEKEKNIKEKAITILSFPIKEVSSVVKGTLDVSEDTLLSLRSEDPNFMIQEKAVEYVRAFNAASLKVVFAGPVNKVSSVIEDVFNTDESNMEGMGNVTPWVAEVERRKIVKCYVQGSRRRKRKKVIGGMLEKWVGITIILIYYLGYVFRNVRKVNQECFSRQHLKGKVVLKE
uniref:Class II heat shock protein n=1 Tax=Tanacetum cinerariifolium TaxID=118510 RepID=A0A6L2P030_TANCI|nr:class II heat shock protein [Tanacetum cinerariifolium]